MSTGTKSHNDLFFTKNRLKTKAKWHIRKNPGNYVGNLTFWLENDIPTATKKEIYIVYLQLMKEGFFFDNFGAVYPPENLKNKGRDLKKLVENFGLEDMDLEIFLALEYLGKNSNMRNTAIRVVSINSDYDERCVKYRIGFLFKNKFILAQPSKQHPQYLAVNMGITW